MGYLITRNATTAGAEGGCQAEVGAASAMAASAAVELFGGTPAQCLDAASFAIVNILGLVCDPIGGLVENPCQNRNAMGASNALISAELSMAGIKSITPIDETIGVMYAVGRSIFFPSERQGRLPWAVWRSRRAHVRLARHVQRKLKNEEKNSWQLIKGI